MDEDKTIPPGLRTMIGLLILIINLFIAKFSVNSKNSSKPPSSDPNRIKKPKTKGERKPGGQNGHQGKNLEFISNPDEIVDIKLDENSLPKGCEYKDFGFEARQVVDIKISRIVTEYRAQILKDQDGKKYIAPFPEGVASRIQYGNSVKAHSVYMCGFQMIPYNRITDYFLHQMKIPVSAGSIFNFNQEAYNKLALFEEIAKKQLVSASRINSDETGINIGGKRKWLHVVSNDLWTLFYPHDKRGSEAMDEVGILPNFAGVLCHDHWTAYYTYKQCLHSLCNSHHIRELESVVELNNHTWAKKMQSLLFEINKAKQDAGGAVTSRQADIYRKQYRCILADGEVESPLPQKLEGPKKKRGRIKKEKHRNLLERLRDFEDDVLRFMENKDVPFTNNQAENDIRMVKVQQKISGCFRTMEGAKIFCRVRSYLLTAQKHNIKPSEALACLFAGILPDFCGAE